MGVGCASHLLAGGRGSVESDDEFEWPMERENGEKKRMLDIRVKGAGYEAYGGVGSSWEWAGHWPNFLESKPRYREELVLSPRFRYCHHIVSMASCNQSPSVR